MNEARSVMRLDLQMEDFFEMANPMALVFREAPQRSKARHRARLMEQWASNTLKLTRLFLSFLDI